MMGKQHMVVSSAIVVASACLCRIGLLSYNSIGYEISLKLTEYFYPIGLQSVWFGSWSVLLFVAMLFGTLLPDIDSKRSTLGRYFYIPIEHRTWTHTAWVVIVLFALGFKWTVFGAIGVGYFLHLLIDAISVAGICWFYPIQKYRHYGNGAFVAANHKVKLCYAGRLSEKVVAVSIVVLCIVVCVMTFLH